jgi:DNA-binding XRE family transcriptional regulator
MDGTGKVYLRCASADRAEGDIDQKDDERTAAVPFRVGTQEIPEAVKTEEPMKAAFALKIARLTSGMTQAELGAACGKYSKFVQRIEKGGPVRVTPELARKLSDVLGVPEDFLFPKVIEKASPEVPDEQ